MTENEIKGIPDLMIEFEDEKVSLKDTIKEVEQLTKSVQTLVPKSGGDFKSGYHFESRIKTVVDFYKILSDLKKQLIIIIEKQIKLKQSMEGDGSESKDLLTKFSMIAEKISSVTKEVEDIKKKDNVSQQCSKKNTSNDETDEDNIDEDGLPEPITDFSDLDDLDDNTGIFL